MRSFHTELVDRWQSLSHLTNYQLCFRIAQTISSLIEKHWKKENTERGNALSGMATLEIRIWCSAGKEKYSRLLSQKRLHLFMMNKVSIISLAAVEAAVAVTGFHLTRSSV